MCFSYIVLEKKRIVGILEPITSFHKKTWIGALKLQSFHIVIAGKSIRT